MAAWRRIDSACKLQRAKSPGPKPTSERPLRAPYLYVNIRLQVSRIPSQYAAHLAGHNPSLETALLLLVLRPPSSSFSLACPLACETRAPIRSWPPRAPEPVCWARDFASEQRAPCAQCVHWGLRECICSLYKYSLQAAVEARTQQSRPSLCVLVRA